ncbi:hypothetical protein C1645_840763 [Glomus cerebriforme]|uniref:P-loop containing nucleoside triphosphate hydrolase protein n=1 Tax=Glomus cerebriforme TaxID=658196 RepID=A0A397SAP5_9GLOM|nr:hypothetical protein C1645_840763 [Glomus cerebriforme]
MSPLIFRESSRLSLQHGRYKLSQRFYTQNFKKFLENISLFGPNNTFSKNMKIINQEDHQNIAKLIANRNKPAESCYLLFGPRGVGKSVLATLASESAKSEYMKYLLPTYYDYKETFHEFERLTEKRWMVNYTPLLIIDDFKVDHLDDLIKVIQHSAKVALQNGSYNVMFIIDDKKSLEFFMDDITLMEFIYLGDLNEDVALSYLYDHQVDRDFAKKIYEIFGGRISDLNQVINYLT